MLNVVNWNWQYFFIAAIPWTIVNAIVFLFLALLFEPYSLTYYLNGYGSLNDFNMEEIPRYVGYLIVLIVGGTMTFLPLGWLLYVRYFKRNGRV